MRGLMPQYMLDQTARRFRLLGDPVRLELLNHLHVEGEQAVHTLAEATGQTHANVSKHLGLLAREGFVRRRKDGLFVYYSIADPTLPALCLLVCGQVPAEMAGAA